MCTSQWHLRRSLLVGLLTTITSGSVASAQYENLRNLQLVNVQVASDEQFQALLKLKRNSPTFEIWSDVITDGALEVRVSSEDAHKLARSGFRYTILIEDLQAHFQQLFDKSAGADFFDAYRSYDEHVAFLNDLVTNYPSLVEMVDMGTSVEGRKMWAIRISSSVDNKPAVLYHGGQHGNEIIGPHVIAYFASELLGQYGTDPTATAVVDGLDTFLLPIMNPDGYVRGDRENANRVDLNRNWGGPGSLPTAFSEPETSAIRVFMEANPQIKSYVDVHSYGYMILWPWGHTPDLCENNESFSKLGFEMREEILSVFGTDYAAVGPANTTIYPFQGGSIDYAYGVHDIWGYVFEVGSWHSPGSQNVRPLSEELYPALLHLSSWAFDCNENLISDADELTAGSVDNCNSNATPDECEATLSFNFDGDAHPDACDDDIDDDGILNDNDICDFSQAGATVMQDGRYIGDRDQDCDLDLADYLRFDDCIIYAKEASDALIRWCLSEFDADGDQEIDLVDFARIQSSFSGP